MKQPVSRSRVRILLVEDHVLFAESLDLALTIEGYDVRRVPVPTEAVSPGALLSRLIGYAPRIILLDLDLGTFGDGMRLVPKLATAGINVIVVTGTTDRARWGEAIAHGARTVLPKSEPLNEILATVRKISQGQPVLDHQEREELLRIWQENRRDTIDLLERLDALTVREAQVLGQLMRGRTVAEIAEAGVVSQATVRTQVKSILAKLEVSSQIAAVGLAHRAGWSVAHAS